MTEAEAADLARLARLADAGRWLDAREATFWQGGLGLLERMITELEGMEKG